MKLLPLFSRYIGIGGLVFILYIGVFQLLIIGHIYRPLATTIAYVLAVTCQFILNKFLNFKNFERSTARQLKTYIVVVTFCWFVTVLVIEACVRWLRVPPVGGQLIAIAVNIPLGFVGNVYLTFGGGIRATLRRWQRYLR